jgi:hypothetical protein
MFKRAVTQTLIVALVCAGAVQLSIGQASAAMHYISPGQSWAQVLAQASPGDTVVVRNGVHPRQTITQRFADTVRVVGESTSGVSVQGLNVTSGASHLVFTGMTITTAGAADTQSAVKIYGGASYVALDRVRINPQSHAGVEVHNWGGAPHHIRISDSTISGQASSATTTGRNVWIGDLQGGDRTTWPSDIEILRNDLGYASADSIHLSGAATVTIEGNEIHDLKANEDHNDGIQSVASHALRIVRNRISSPGTWSCSTCVPPDQAIIVGHAYPASTYKKVTQTYIADNIVHHWRGKGVMTTGTSDTRIVNNTITRLGLPGTMTAAALTVSEPYGYKNEALRIYNNVIDRLAVAVTTPIAYIGHNCILAGGTGEQNVSADPSFTNVTTEFTLATDSPCVAKGVRTSGLETPAVDFAGVPILDPVDVGARQLNRTGSDGTTATTAAPTTTTTAPPVTTTTTAPTTTTVPAADQTVILNGSIGNRNGGTRAHDLQLGAGTVSVAVDEARVALTLEIQTGHGPALLTRKVAAGETITLDVAAGRYRLLVGAAEQTKYSLVVRHAPTS